MRQTAGWVAVTLLALLGCSKHVIQRPVAKAQDPLLGEWVSDGQGNIEGVTTATFMPGGAVDISDRGQKVEHYFYVREPIAEWEERREGELAKSHPGVAKALKKNDVDLGTVFGQDTEVLLMSKDQGRLPDFDMMLMFSPSRKSLMFPMMLAFVRPGHEKRYSQRKDDGDGSSAPFKFLAERTPVFADQTTGDWGYSVKAEWAALLKEASKELKEAGFETPGGIDDPARIAGKHGAIFYRSSDSENVSLTPNLRSRRPKGKWITTPTPGWVTVHVAIKVRQR